MDLIDDPAAGQNAPEFSVSDIAGAVKRTLESSFSRIRVKGEVGRVMRARSGHVYFDLKDDRSVIASVAWKGVASRLSTQPEEGIEVVVTGRISAFGPQSKYQLIVDDIAVAGMGALMVMLEKRRKALAAEGLFDPERKKPLPYLPQVIGVVTSPSGAVIRDILHRLRDRFPREVLVWPVTVQGENCAREVAAAIKGFNALGPDSAVTRPDVLIVARGGGSVEDLWGFNEEAVVRAIADSDIPVISAVGHETDTSLADHAADLRAPTPTAAAEHAVPVRIDLMHHLAGLEERRVGAMSRLYNARRDRLRDLARALPRPDALLNDRRQRLDGAADRLPRALGNLTQRRRIALGEKTGRFGPMLLTQALRTNRERVVALGRNLSGDKLTARARDEARALRQITQQFRSLAGASVARHRERLNGLERLRETLGYRATLRRGYAVVRSETGDVLSSAVAAEAAAALSIEFADGALEAQAVGAQGTEKPSKPKRPAKPKAKKDDQGSLF